MYVDISGREGPVAERMREGDLFGKREMEIRRRESIRWGRSRERTANWKDSIRRRASPLCVRREKEKETRDVERVEGAAFVFYRTNVHRVRTVHRFYTHHQDQIESTGK